MQDPVTGGTIAELVYHEWTGELRQVRVHCPGHEEWEESGGPHTCLRRRGIATALLKIARSIASVPIVHSVDRSDAGEAWARAVVEPGEVVLPRRILPPGTVSHKTMKELIGAA